MGAVFVIWCGKNKDFCGIYFLYWRKIFSKLKFCSTFSGFAHSYPHLSYYPKLSFKLNNFRLIYNNGNGKRSSKERSNVRISNIMFAIFTTKNYMPFYLIYSKMINCNRNDKNERQGTREAYRKTNDVAEIASVSNLKYIFYEKNVYVFFI